MPVSTDVLNTTLADLRGPLTMGFEQNIPLFRHVEKSGNISSERGTYIERPLMGGSPAQLTGIFGGSETLDMTRTEQTKRYRVEPHRMVAAIGIPKRDLRINEGRLGAVKLLKEYPKAFQEAIGVDIERYLLTGISAALAASTASLLGLTTLNGQKATGLLLGTTNGLLDFAAIGSQTDTVQNVAKATSYYHYNQYNSITSYATDGDDKLRKTYRQCAQFAPQGKGPDIILADDDTFGNYTLGKKDIVRLEIVGGKTDNGNLMVDSLGLGKMEASQLLVLSEFTGTAAAGVAYFINSMYWEWIWFQKPEISDFEDRIANQDTVNAKWEAHGGHIMTKFPAHGICDGGATK